MGIKGEVLLLLLLLPLLLLPLLLVVAAVAEAVVEAWKTTSGTLRSQVMMARRAQQGLWRGGGVRRVSQNPPHWMTALQRQRWRWLTLYHHHHPLLLLLPLKLLPPPP